MAVNSLPRCSCLVRAVKWHIESLANCLLLECGCAAKRTDVGINETHSEVERTELSVPEVANSLLGRKLGGNPHGLPTLCLSATSLQVFGKAQILTLPR